MNWLDLVIIIVAISAIFRGAKIGSIRQIFSAAGFIGGLLLGSFLAPHIIGHSYSPTARSWLSLIITLGSALVFLGAGEYLGFLVELKLQGRKAIKKVDSGLGAVVGFATLMATIWLSAAILISLPLANLQVALRDSAIISFMNRNLPSAPNVLADLGHIIDPNGFPKVFIGGEPSPPDYNTPIPSNEALAPAINKDKDSVVQIEGQGCGGIIEGSGFVVAPGLVATNAHVVAGVAQPYVLDKDGTHRAAAVLFDPNVDFAILRVNNLAGHPLTINTYTEPQGTPAAVLGFPGGGGFTANAAAVLDEFMATGRNIYGQGQTVRSIYEIKAKVIPGNSGGPLIDSNGSVIGVVFAESTTYNQVGYALTAGQVNGEIAQAEHSSGTVSTSACAQ